MINNYLNQNMNIASMNRDNSSLESLKGKVKGAIDKNDKKLKDASEDFEAVFINQLLQLMDKTIQRSDFMKAGRGEEMFRGMFYQEMSKEIAKGKSNIGLANQIYKQLS